MSARSTVYIGTDGGATMSKVGGVWEDGATISTELLQRPTNAGQGTESVVRGWVDAADDFLKEHDLSWDQVRGVGLATPGPFLRYGVLGRAANLPKSFEGFDMHADYSAALADRAGRPIPLTVGNDANMGAVAEADKVRSPGDGTVLMLAPGSGLGAAFIGRDGLPLEGDSLTGMEGGHMQAALFQLGVPPYPCGCGRDWGCIEVYTTLSGLPYLLEEILAERPDHELAKSDAPLRVRALALRGLAQEGDELALEIFDFQARALGYHLANLMMAVDPRFVVIGGGLMDPEATTREFRDRYLSIVRETALPNLWPVQREQFTVVPARLGDLSQAIGAALVALYTEQSR